MKTTTLLAMTALVTMTVSLNAADMVASPRALAQADSFKKVGNPPGDKIDRPGMTMSPRIHAQHTSTDKVGTAPGDKSDRSVTLVSPRARETFGIKIAPLK